MENNKNMRDLYRIYLELGHEVFEEKIKKPMELYLHANGNVISMNSLNTIIANDMEKSKLGEASCDEHDIFSPPSMEEKIYFDDTLPPIHDDYNDENSSDSNFVEFAPLQLIRMLMWRVAIILCMWLMIRMFHVIV